MAQNSEDCENHIIESELNDSEENKNDTKTDSPVESLDGLSLNSRDELEDEEEGDTSGEKTDEGDGILKKIGSLTCVVVKKKGTKKEEIEPYSTTQESWTYSKYAPDITETDVEHTSSSQTAVQMKQSSSQRSMVTETVNIIESDCYNFTFSKRGYLLLVINETFYNQASRKGAHLDLLKMKAVAKKFGFEILNNGGETNLTKSETMNWLLKAQSTDHSATDCFMFMISTHGLEQENPRKDGLVDHALVCADDQLIFTSTIIDMFNDIKCPSLKGKPKIFIIQACRGTSVDHGSDMNISQNKNRPSSSLTDRKAKSDQATRLQSDVSDTKAAQDTWDMDPSRDTEMPCLKCDADMLIMYAIPPGMLAWRNTVDGSWMIHYLHELLMAYDMKAPKSFINILTKVAAKMSLRTTDTPSVPEIHEKKAIPVIEHMLTRDILFSQKL